MNTLTCTSVAIAQPKDELKPSRQERFYAKSVSQWSVKMKTPLHVKIYYGEREDYEIIATPSGNWWVSGVGFDRNEKFSPRETHALGERTIHGNPDLSSEEKVFSLGVSDLAYRRWGGPLKVLVESEDRAYAIQALLKEPSSIDISITSLKCSADRGIT